MTKSYMPTFFGERETVTGPAGTFAECVDWAAANRRVMGPNGPVEFTQIRRLDGSVVLSWTHELAAEGRVPVMDGSRIVGSKTAA